MNSIEFLNKITSTIKKYSMLDLNSNKNDKIVLGLSGGADSTALFHVLLKLDFKICAVHINHGIREDAASDEQFVVKLCNKYNVELKVFNFDIKKISEELNLSEEEAGRKVRYESFYSVLNEKGYSKIAVAHNKNDQAETVLLRLFRGAGMAGLSAIPPISQGDILIRPLIDCSRLEILQFLSENNLSFVNDSSNSKDIYDRNKVRLNLLPYISENFNKNIVNTLARTSEIISRENIFLEKLAVEAYNKCCVDGCNLSISALKNYDDVIKNRVLRLALFNCFKTLKDIESVHIQSIINLLNNQSGKKTSISNGIIVEKSYDKLIFYKNTTNSIKDFEYVLQLNKLTFIYEISKYVSVCENNEIVNKNLNNVCTKHFYCDRILDSRFILRNRRVGDKIFFDKVGSKKVKNFFNDIKLPKDKRECVPFIVFEDENFQQNILWIIDYATNGKFDKRNHDLSSIIIVQIWEDIKNE